MSHRPETRTPPADSRRLASQSPSPARSNRQNYNGGGDSNCHPDFRSYGDVDVHLAAGGDALGRDESYIVCDSDADESDITNSTLESFGQLSLISPPERASRKKHVKGIGSPNVRPLVAAAIPIYAGSHDESSISSGPYPYGPNGPYFGVAGKGRGRVSEYEIVDGPSRPGSNWVTDSYGTVERQMPAKGRGMPTGSPQQYISKNTQRGTGRGPRLQKALSSTAVMVWDERGACPDSKPFKAIGRGFGAPGNRRQTGDFVPPPPGRWKDDSVAENEDGDSTPTLLPPPRYREAETNIRTTDPSLDESTVSNDSGPPPPPKYRDPDTASVVPSAINTSRESSKSSLRPSSKYRNYIRGCCEGDDSSTKISMKSRTIDMDRAAHYWGLAKRPYGKSRYIDTHCHLDLLFKRDGFSGTLTDYKKKYRESWASCYEGCIADFCYPVSFTSTKPLWLSLMKEADVYSAFGCHPHVASDYSDEIEKIIIDRLAHDKVIAVGEMGLDYSRNNQQDHDLQKKVFRRQLEIAKKSGKPLLIHCRDAEDDCYEIMKEVVPHDYRIHRHCFNGGLEDVKRWADNFTNLKIGLTTGVYEARSRQLDLLQKFPLDRIVIETDTPYFLPRYARRNEFGGLEYNHPGMGYIVASRLAEDRNMDMVEVLDTIRNNTKQLYGI